VVLAVLLGAVVAANAGPNIELAWVGVGAAGFLVALGCGLRSTVPLHLGVAVLAALLLLRQDDRLLLAPLYGSGLVLVDELAWRSVELAVVERIGPEVIRARMAAVGAVVGVGACAATGAALAVTAGPGRSVALTAVGALAVAAVFAGIGGYARRRFGRLAADPPPTSGGDDSYR